MYKFCPHCGKPLVEGAGFCPHCGARIMQEEEAAPADSAQSAAPEQDMSGAMPESASSEAEAAPKEAETEEPEIPEPVSAPSKEDTAEQSPAPVPSEGESVPQNPASSSDEAESTPPVQPAVQVQPGTPAAGKPDGRKWGIIAAAAAAVVLVLVFGVRMLSGDPPQEDTAASAATAQLQDTEKSEEETSAPTPTLEPTPKPTPKPTEKPADAAATGKRLIDSQALTYADRPWYGAWKNVDEGWIMIWEGYYKIWASESFEQTADGGYNITLTDQHDTDFPIQEFYKISADYDHLKKVDAYGNVLEEYVTPARSDVKDALPEDWWGGYQRIDDNYDRYSGASFMLVDAFRIGDNPYKDAVDNGDGTYSVTANNGMEEWQDTLARYDEDGVQYLLFVDQDGYVAAAYAKQDTIQNTATKPAGEGDWNAFARIVITYYQSYLTAINEQDPQCLTNCTEANRKAMVERITGGANAGNQFDPNSVIVTLDTDSFVLDGDTAAFNATFMSHYTGKNSGEEKDLTNHQTVYMVLEDNWKVDGITFVSDDDFAAHRLAPMPD